MAKPIKLNEEEIDRILADLKEKIKKNKMADGKLKIEENFAYKAKSKTTVMIEPFCYEKMLYLLATQSKEIGWHMTVRREENTFVCTDLLIYPQTVTGTTVDTDQKEYEKWFMEELSDEEVNTLHCHCHSHVNMGVSPSSRDLGDQQNTISQLTSNSFYIFMIWNKELDHWVRIYDMTTNTMYENDDIEVIVDDVAGMDEDIKSKVNVKSCTAPAKKSSKKKNEEDDDDLPALFDWHKYGYYNDY